MRMSAHPIQDPIEGNSRFRPRQRRTWARMRTPAERDVLTNVAAIVPKLVRVLELLRIAVAHARQKHDDGARRARPHLWRTCAPKVLWTTRFGLGRLSSPPSSGGSPHQRSWHGPSGNRGRHGTRQHPARGRRRGTTRSAGRPRHFWSDVRGDLGRYGVSGRYRRPRAMSGRRTTRPDWSQLTIWS